ncbi:MAG: hypothetical protein V3S21_08000 [Xanthomonadales bacterium]
MTPERDKDQTESASSEAENTQPIRRARTGWTLKELRPFDYLVLAGALVNLVVIIGIIVFFTCR